MQFIRSLTASGKSAKPKTPAGVRRVGDMLPYSRHADRTTLETHDGQLVKVLHLKGFAFETADTSELNYRKNVRDAILRSIASSRLTIGAYIIRHKAESSLEGAFRTEFARSLDAVWRRRLAEKSLFRNDLFLTITRTAPLAGGMGMRIADAGDGLAVGRARAQRELETACETLTSSLAAYGPRLLEAYETPQGAFSELLEFLAFIYSGEARPVPIAGEPAHAVGDRRISFGSEAFELAQSDGRPALLGAMVSVREYPPHTSAGLLDGLLRLPHALVASQSFSFIERQPALDRMNLALRRMRAADDEALSLRHDLIQAKDDVASGRAAFGEHHFTVRVSSATFQGLDAAVADVQACLTEAGLMSVRERTALEPSFWAQFPGNGRFTPRRAMISSTNFAGLASFHNYPTGAASNNHWGPAVTVLETTSASPYYFSFHNGDLGNFLLIGPSGSGKTVILGFLLAQAERFHPRIAYFDKDRGAEVFIRASGGRYEILRAGAPTGFNPLQIPDSPAGRRFLQQWTARLLTANGELLSSEDLSVIASAVAANFEQERHYRRLRYFRELFLGGRRPQPGDLASRLSPWVDRGDHAWLFDNEDDTLNLNDRLFGFDMTGLLDDPVTRTPAMMYLFHRIEDQLDGNPALIVIDEGWKALDDDVFVSRLKDWEKTIRKRNGVVGFATQSAADALQSRVASAIIEQSATQIFLPNQKAQADEYRNGFGLSEHEFDIIRTLPDTSRCFLIKKGGASVVARLDLRGEKELLTLLSGRERTVRLLDKIRAELGEDPARWVPALLEATR